MTSYVEIAVNVPKVTGVFHYHLPPELEGQVSAGQLVVVPFGVQVQQGVVLREVDEPQVAETKAVRAIVDDGVVLTRAQIALAEWMAEATLAPAAACIALMLPSGVTSMGAFLYELADQHAVGKTKNQAKIIEALKTRGALTHRQLDRVLPRASWQYALRPLLATDIVASRAILPLPGIRPKKIKTAQLGNALSDALSTLNERRSRGEVFLRRKKMLEFLGKEGTAVDVSWVYAESGGSWIDLKYLNKYELVMLREEEAWRDPLAGLAYDPAAPPQLTADQAAAWKHIEAALHDARIGQTPRSILLHGVTGSGKTELYLRAVDKVLKEGKQAIVLVPEIALTPQTTRRFMARFPGRVGLLHSGLSEGERYDTWRRARQGRLSVIIGPRSALFAPLPDIGLIVVDEAHDDSYYQDGMLPYYHARDVARQYAKMIGALCLLGTATPDAVTYHRAQRGEIDLLELPARILAHRDSVRAHVEKLGLPSRYLDADGESASIDLPPVQVVDMRGELRQGNRSIFSRALQDALGEVLSNGQQAILFLNRRGSATYVFCRDCGEALRCPNCETNLTYHQSGEALRCHHCGHQQAMPKHCPNCQSERIRQYGSGTQRVEEEVAALFPQARTLRWDHETTREKGAHEIILSHFTNQRADILIGTQMLAKGLDLPLVTLVGVALADVGLTLPDYRAGERVFQVLTQVAGRAGRSPLGGRVILQSFQPEHYVIQHAAKHDFTGFMQQELSYRQRLGYPPFIGLARLEIRDKNPVAAQEKAEKMGRDIHAWIEARERRATEVIGPAPCFYERLGGEYRWQVIVRGPDPAGLLRDHDLAGWRVEVNPQALL
jgi:primosomal protein N' (replication factor Y)